MMHVRFFHAAGLHVIDAASNGPLLVDRSPPVVRFIADGLMSDINYQQDLTMICMNGDFGDVESGVIEVYWGIGEYCLDSHTLLMFYLYCQVALS